MRQRHYLKADVVVEPLLDRWHAWSHIVAPATAAMHVANRHVRLMRSYLEAPDLHAAAVANPQLRGGQFVDLPPARLEDVRALLDFTIRERGHQLALAAAITEANRMLRTCNGLSLEPLYRSLPDALRGYVELVYDLENRASLNFIEPLLYRSLYYDKKGQGFLLSRADWRDRPFMLNTPRFEDAGSVHINTHFADQTIDALQASRHEGCDSGEMLERLGLQRQRAALCKHFFTDVPPPARSSPTGEMIRWRYFGHACVLLEYAGQSILVDPVVCYAANEGEPRYSLLDLPAHIDYVLITHNHQDHLILEMLLQIRHKVGTIIVPPPTLGALQDPSIRLMLQHVGFKSVRELGVLESIDLKDGNIIGVPFLGEHADLNIGSKLAYLVRFGARTFAFVADSRVLEPRLYELVHQLMGPIDTLFVGMECDGAPISWVYGALLPTPLARSADQSRRTAGSDCEQALSMIHAMQCRATYVYAMGQEPWLNYISRFRCEQESPPMIESRKFIEACRSRGVVAERLYGMKEIVLDGNAP